MDNIIIIGSGLSGLTLGYYLKKNNIPFKIVEAQNRIGGRIETRHGVLDTPMEMGATWFGALHTHLLDLLQEIEIEYFEQHSEGKSIFKTKSFEPPQIFFVPKSEAPSFRIKNGTATIIEKLVAFIGKESIVTSSEITQIQDIGEGISLKDAAGNVYLASQVVSTIPPQILVDTVAFEPSLPSQLVELMGNVQTWMSASIKFSVEYETPFWLENGFSGTVFSQSGSIVEMYDHSNFERSKFALMGFLNGSVANYSFEQRETFVLEQIETLFGVLTKKAISYHDKIWDNKYLLTTNPKLLLAHQNNGHPLLQTPLLNGKFFLGGTETATVHPGYLEGAVAAALRVCSQIIATL
jgi:monoamine oxidase